MRILMIATVPPYPLYYGDRLMVFHLGRALAERGHTVDLLALSQRPGDSGEQHHYAGIFGHVELIDGAHHTPAAFLARLLRPSRHWPARAEDSWVPGMWRAIERRLDEGRYDAVQLLGGTHIYEYFGALRGVPAVITPADSFGLRARRMFQADGVGLRARLTGRLRWLTARAYERWMYDPFARTVVLSDVDAAPHGRLGCLHDRGPRDLRRDPRRGRRCRRALSGGRVPAPQARRRFGAAAAVRPPPPDRAQRGAAFPLELLAQRRTARGAYDGRRAAADALSSLEALTKQAGHLVRFTSEPADVDWIVALNADTVFYDLADDEVRAEIGRWVRRSEREARQTRDGFSPRCLGFPGPLVNLFFFHHRLFSSRPARAILRRLLLHSTRGTRTVGWIQGPWSTPEDWYESGRMLMRFWLELTRHGLYLQPYGSVITNPTAHALMANKLAVDASQGEVWLLLRLGYCPPPARSLRRRRELLR